MFKTSVDHLDLTEFTCMHRLKFVQTGVCQHILNHMNKVTYNLKDSDVIPGEYVSNYHKNIGMATLPSIPYLKDFRHGFPCTGNM